MFSKHVAYKLIVSPFLPPVAHCMTDLVQFITTYSFISKYIKQIKKKLCWVN